MPVFSRGPEPGAQFGRYRILEPIASGGMARLWLAEFAGAEGFRKRMVLKTMLPHLSENRSLVAMFIEEATVAAEFDHENVVRVFDFGCFEDQYFIAMEYIVGRTLRQTMRRARDREFPVDKWALIRVLASVCDALDYVHTFSQDGVTLGLLHRDVSPENIMISFKGTVKLLDFGVAHNVKSTVNTGMVVGRYRYMAPERLDGSPGFATSDLFSVGVILYELLSGLVPFKGADDVATVKAILAGAPRLNDVAPTIDPRLAAIVDRAIAPHPMDRHPSAATLARDLRRHLSRTDGNALSRSLAPLLSVLFSDADDLPSHVRANHSGSSQVPAVEEGTVAQDMELVIAEGVRPAIERPYGDARTPLPSSSTSDFPSEAPTSSRAGPIRRTSDIFSVTPPPPLASASSRDPFSLRRPTQSDEELEWELPPSSAPAASWSPRDWGLEEAKDPPAVAPAETPVEAARAFEDGLAALSEKDYTAALSHWQTALALAPGNRLYRANMNRLKERLAGMSTNESVRKAKG